MCDFLQEGDRKAQRAFGERVRTELSEKVLDIPKEYIQISGVYPGTQESPAIIIVDLNVHSPKEDPRTSRQLFAQLSAHVGDDSSVLHTQVQACSRTVRVMMRGAVHEVYERFKQKAEIEDLSTQGQCAHALAHEHKIWR